MDSMSAYILHIDTIAIRFHNCYILFPEYYSFVLPEVTSIVTEFPHALMAGLGAPEFSYENSFYILCVLRGEQTTNT